MITTFTGVFQEVYLRHFGYSDILDTSTFREKLVREMSVRWR